MLLLIDRQVQFLKPLIYYEELLKRHHIQLQLLVIHPVVQCLLLPMEIE
jgi:hypothetical protein